MKNKDYKFKEQHELILNSYRTEDFKNKVQNVFKSMSEDFINVLYRFFKNEELTNREYQIVLKIINAIIMDDHNKIQKLISIHKNHFNEKKQRINYYFEKDLIKR